MNKFERTYEHLRLLDAELTMNDADLTTKVCLRLAKTYLNDDAELSDMVTAAAYLMTALEKKLREIDRYENRDSGG